MKIFIDTNVLISAFVFGGKAGILLKYLIGSENELILSSYVDTEFKEKLHEKWPEKAEKLYKMFHEIEAFHFVESSNQVLGELRDEKDVPVLSDALFYNADILLTGDKDFLESDIENPNIMSPAELYNFLNLKA